MRFWGLLVSALLLSAAGQATDVREFLSPDDPTDRAILAYLQLVEDDQAGPGELTELGVLLANRGFPEEAEDALRAAMKADKESFDAAYRLGLLLQRQGKGREATQVLQKAVKLQPTDPYALFMLATAEERSGREKAAVRDYVRAFRAMPELADESKNPLILDSGLRLQAQIEYYRQVVGSTSFDLTALDPEAVKLMMEAQPAPVEAPPEEPVEPEETPPPAEPGTEGGPPRA